MSYKVIQWATGPVGRSALRHILINPDYELAGVYVHSQEKVGADAATLVGLPPCGVLTTDDRDAILATQADAVVYSPRMHFDTKDMDHDVLALLASGKNVVTPAGYWFPPLYGEDYVATVEAACVEGSASLFGSGENPGFFLARLAPIAAAAVSELRSVELAEFIDCAHHPSQPMVFDVLGFGKQPEELSAGGIIAAMLDRCFQEEISLVAQKLGITVDGFDKESRFATLDRDVELEIGTVPAGGVVAQSHRWSGLKSGVTIISIVNTWFVSQDVPGWDLDDHWLITLDARPALTIDVRGATSLTESPVAKFADTDSGPMDHITAMTCVNAIPRVCAAAPGIVYPDVGDTPVVWTAQSAAAEPVA